MNLRESFSLPYNGGELWYSCLDNLNTDTQLIIEKILKEEKLICRTSSSSFILYHLYNTEITDELAEVLMNSLVRSQNYISKLTIIGLSKNGKTAMKNLIKRTGLQINVPIKYFDDFELAKEWLIKV